MRHQCHDWHTLLVLLAGLARDILPEKAEAFSSNLLTQSAEEEGSKKEEQDRRRREEERGVGKQDKGTCRDTDTSTQSEHNSILSVSLCR